MAEFFDSHCHLDTEVFGTEIPAVIRRAREVGVRYLTTIGSFGSLEYAQHAVRVAETHDEVWASVGIHPHEARLCDDPLFDEIASLAARPKVVAIGETGLDYHYDSSPRDVQQQVFRRFVGLARELDKPLIVHVRDAFDDCLQILEDEGAHRLRVVIHCFSGSLEEGRRALELGCWISIPGIVTFKKPGQIPEVAALVPEERLLLETDSPYLAPAPLRGKQNEPAYLVHTAARVAALRGVSIDALATRTTENALRFYGLK